MLQDLFVRDVAAEDFERLFPNFFKKEILLHDAAAEHDHFGRKHDEGVRAELRKLISLNIPADVIERQILRGNAPAQIEGRPLGKPLEAAFMIGAETVRIGVLGMGL